MTRRKRTPPSDSPGKPVAFEIPNSLAQLSALSRSLAQRTDTIHGAPKEVENSGIIARAQALSNSPSQTGSSQVLKPIRWRHDQKDFPDTQTWIQPVPSGGARAHAKALEHQWKEAQALELSRQADMLSSIHGQQSFPPMAMPSQNYATHGDSNLPRGDPSFAGARKPESDQSPDPESSAAVGRKRKRVEFVTRYQGDCSNSQPWPRSIARGGTRSFDDDTEQRRQAIVTQLMQTGPVSVSSAGTNIQVPTNPAARASIDRTPEQLTDVNEALDLAKDSSQIAQLIAKKRAENAATGQLNRLQYLQAEHRQRQAGQQSWPGSGQPVHYLSMPVPQAANLPAWPASPSPAPIQPSIETNHATNQAGYAEASTANKIGGEENTELDLRYLFSSPGHETRRENRNEEDETERALRNAINSAGDITPALTQPLSASVSVPRQSGGRDAVSPSDQLLSNLAHVSSDALAQLNTKNSTSGERRLPVMAPPPPFPASRLPQLAARRFYKAPIQTPQAQAKVAATLTPQQQELMLIQRQTEKREIESKTQELRKVAEERAKQLQALNQTKVGQNEQHEKQLQEPVQQEQGEWMPQPSTMAHTTVSSAHWKTHQTLWGNTGFDGYRVRNTSYVQPRGTPSGGTASSGEGDSLQRPWSTGYSGFASGGGTTAARFRNAGQIAFEVPKR